MKPQRRVRYRDGSCSLGALSQWHTGISAEASDSTAVKHMGQRDIEIDHVLRDGSLNGGLDRVLC